MKNSRESDVLMTHSLTSHFIGETSELAHSAVGQVFAMEDYYLSERTVKKLEKVAQEWSEKE